MRIVDIQQPCWISRCYLAFFEAQSYESLLTCLYRVVLHISNYAICLFENELMNCDISCMNKGVITGSQIRRFLKRRILDNFFNKKAQSLQTWCIEL